MNKYEYKRHMTDDIKDWILMNGIITHAQNEQWSIDELANWLSDELWSHDSITGNGPCGYAIEEKCEEYLKGNLGLYFDAAREFDDWPTGVTKWTKVNPAQHMDAIIRCYLLYECIYLALEELNYKVVE